MHQLIIITSVFTEMYYRERYDMQKGHMAAIELLLLCGYVAGAVTIQLPSYSNNCSIKAEFTNELIEPVLVKMSSPL